MSEEKERYKHLRDPKFEAVYELMTKKGFDNVYKITPYAAAKSWEQESVQKEQEKKENANKSILDMGFYWAADSLHKFFFYCIWHRVSPHATAKEVSVTARGGRLQFSTTAHGGLCCLRRYNVIEDVLQKGVVYEGEEYERLPNQMMHHVPSADLRNKQLKPLFGYIVVQRPNGNIIRYELAEQQLNDPKRNKAIGEKNYPAYGPWHTNRHEMYLKSMNILAYKNLLIHADPTRVPEIKEEEPAKDEWPDMRPDELATENEHGTAIDPDPAFPYNPEDNTPF